MSTEVIRGALGAAEEFLQQVRQAWPKRPRMPSVGSCCLLGAVSADTVCVTNLADSRAVLGRRVVWGGVAVACCLLGAVSVDTLCVANLADSRAVLGHRVVGGGVAVADPFSAEHSAAFEEVRLELAALHPDDGQIVLHIRGQWRVKGIIQAV